MKPIESFNDLILPRPLVRTLDVLNFTTPTPVQAAAVPVAMAGRDILATAQTGTGKTAAFGLPLISLIASGRRRQALILAPTRELAAQIHKVLHQLGHGMQFQGTLVVGGESFNRQTDELRRRNDFIVATPGRLNDHLSERRLNLSGVDMLILDEVDRMLDMGFAPQIKAIMRYISNKRQTLLFSATLPDEIMSLAHALMRDPVRIAIGPVMTTAPQAVKETTIETSQEGKLQIILKELKTRQGKILVFARTQSRTERLARQLHEQGFPVGCMHGGRTQGQRKQALERFRTGRDRIMVATDIAGRGIDVPDIEHVINYDIPGTREDYIHRIGRTARCGKTGEAVNLLAFDDFDGRSVLKGEKKHARVVFRSSRRRFGSRR
ncbi:MAG: DEAD/DEAH box helicase [Deltaproteobacteria bacterium]|nr:DEAD/DEAH box helicase [Deltaproteobacteria bacterium]MBI3295623.1 DEAD/DEAH box helicase [Deltaproteobacteria bacterium]